MKSWTRMIKLNVETENKETGEIKNYIGKVEVEFHRENYGEDADGNRGIMTTFLDGWEIEELKLDGKDIDFDTLSKDEQDRLENAIDSYIDKYDYED